MPFLCTQRGVKYPEIRNNMHMKKVLQKYAKKLPATPKKASGDPVVGMRTPIQPLVNANGTTWMAMTNAIISALI